MTEDKIFILVMGANADVCPDYTFEDEFDTILKTWAEKLPKNISILYYNGGKYMRNEIEEVKGHDRTYKLHLACEDEMPYTFKKTWMAYKYVYENFDPDWIFRTNTSTYINVELLSQFVGNHANKDITYGSDLYSLSEACCPWPLCVYPRGNGVLTHRDIYKTCIIDNGISLAYQKICDDICFGILINSHNINKHGNYINFIKGLPHAWYRCVDKVFENGHQLSKFGDSEDTIPNYKKFVSVTVKKYRDREKEEEHYLRLHEVVKSTEGDFSWDESMLSYVNNYSVFIGSILGYLDFDVWNNTDKNELFLLEISRKASDDEQHYIYKEIQGKNL